MSTATNRSGGRPTGVRIDGALLRQQRARAGLSREALAELVGATTRTLQRVENEGSASMPLLRSLCEALRLPVVAVVKASAEATRASLREYGFGPGLPPRLVGRESELASLIDLLSPLAGSRPDHDGPGLRLVPDRRHSAPAASSLPAAQVLEARPEPGSKRSTVVVLDGPIGVGKTSLAQQVALDLAQHFDDGVVWVRGAITDIQAVQRDIARALGFEARLPSSGDVSGRDWRQAFSDHFWRNRRLLILDDATDAAHIDAFLSQEYPATILVTTRFVHVAETCATERIQLRPLPKRAIEQILSEGLEPERLESDADGLTRLLALIDGMPGLAKVVHNALRRESLTTPRTWLAHFDRVTRATSSATVAGYYDGLKGQISPEAWELFSALGLFASEPVPLSWARAASGLEPGTLEKAASELLDTQIVNLHESPRHGAGVDGEAWLRLASHPAAAARALLGQRTPDARSRLVASLLERLRAARADSTSALARYYHRHRNLFGMLLPMCSKGLGPAPPLAQLTDPRALDETAGRDFDATSARELVDLITTIAPLMGDHTIANSGEWLGLGLLAARALGEPERRARMALFCGWWRMVNCGLAQQPGWLEAALDDFRAAKRPLGVLATHAMLGVLAAAFGDAETRQDVLRVVLEDVEVDPRPGPERAAVMSHLVRLVLLATREEPPTRAIALSRRALDELLSTEAPDELLVATLLTNHHALCRARPDARAPSLEDAAMRLRELRPEPWLKAAVLAHGASHGAAMGFTSPDAALAAARQELWDCTRDCSTEMAPRLLWFVATAGLYESVIRAGPGGPVMVWAGLGGHGLPAASGIPVVSEMCGLEVLLLLSTLATGALLDAAYIDLALQLAEHVTGGRLVSPALRSLRELMAGQG